MRRLVTVIAVAASLLVAVARAQDAWPTKPVRLVVPSSPGGGTDAYARVLAQGITELLGQQVVVDNRPGASGNIGAEVAAKAPADGHTLLVSANASIAIGPHLYKNLSFDVERDFVPIARGVRSPVALCVQPVVPIRSLAELLAAGKRDPDKMSYGSPGTGSPVYLGMRILEEVSGARFLHVPYKGMGPVYQGFLSGSIQIMFPDVASSLPHIRAGKAIPLAVSEKIKPLPNVPTFTELGYPSMLDLASFSVLGPVAIPQAMVQRISAEMLRVMRVPAVAERLDALVLIPVFDTPADFAVSLKKERDMWGALIKRNGITAEQ
jgi:tripartite-type tricarboxylate transporter receptor subunit TctC